MVKTKQLKEFTIDNNTFMGGWYMSPKICEALIEHFHNNSDKATKGKVGEGNGGVVNKEKKLSKDLQIGANEDYGIIGLYREELQNVLMHYIEKYPAANEVLRFKITENYNLQAYPKGGGFKEWHCENTGNEIVLKRHLVFMTYLNDVEKGGTEFLHQKLITPAQRGLTLIWPPHWTHVHRGQVSENQEKYIMTGWLSFV